MITWSLSYRDISRSLRSDCNIQEGNVVELRQQIEQLLTRLTFPPDTPAPAGTMTKVKRSAKIPDPQKFSGDRSKYREFVALLHLKLVGNANHYDNEQHK